MIEKINQNENSCQDDPKFKDLLTKRNKLADWFCVVSSKLNLGDDVIITSIRIFDIVLNKLNSEEQKTIKIDLIFIACIMISIKYHGNSQNLQVGCPRMNIEFMSKHLSHETFSSKEIIETERYILRKLKFIIPNLNEHELFKKNDNNENFLIFSLKMFLIKFNVIHNYLFLDDFSMEEEYKNICLLIKKISLLSSYKIAKFILKFLRSFIKINYPFLKGGYFEKYVVNIMYGELKLMPLDVKVSK